MADIITSIVGSVALYLVNLIVGRVAPYLVGLFDAVAPHLLDPIGRELDYLFHYRGSIDKLSKEVDELQKVAFPNLEVLSIEYVDSLKEIWPSQLPVDDYSFCRLKSLIISDCEHLFNIVPSNMLMRLQNLELLYVRGANHSVEYIFDVGVQNDMERHFLRSIPLRNLSLAGCPRLTQIWQMDSQLSEYFPFQNLTLLEVTSCSDLRHIFTTSIAKSLVQLQGLYIWSCEMVEEIVENEGVVFPNLKNLELESMSSMKEIWQDQYYAASFGKLRVLQVCNCESLTHVLTFAIAKSLVQIERIVVDNCKMMKVVIASEGEERDETTFSQLNSLELINLPNLTSFWARSNTFSFPSLEEVLVEKCPKLKTFSDGILHTPKLHKVLVQIDEKLDKGFWKGGLNSTIQYLFEQKVEFLRLFELSELKQICYDQFPVGACYVQYLVVEKCTSLLNVVSSIILEGLHNLEKITVESCDSLERVFDLEELDYVVQYIELVPDLEEMNLTELPKLRCLWNKDPEGILSFQIPRWLNIHKCNNLRNLFSPSIIPNLYGLEGLKITDCLNMKEIVERKKKQKKKQLMRSSLTYHISFFKICPTSQVSIQEIIL
ncbi:hypothetical protein L1049_019783 [Liquidambar formosana]|uniref:Disease resistance protein At4g27190-like leucine-rich repeats domain-containing protein n=1 Tax=Liquidambar formosana TaxID=63359 RepID=A0AAP0X9F2_LIQFO